MVSIYKYTKNNLDKFYKIRKNQVKKTWALMLRSGTRLVCKNSALHFREPLYLQLGVFSLLVLPLLSAPSGETDW